PAFADRVLRLDELAVLLAEEERAVAAARLLVRHAREDEIALELGPLAREAAHDGHAHRRVVLHVDGAASPEAAVEDLAGERRMGPALGLDLDHVEAGREQERALPAAAAQPRDDVPAAGRALEDRRLDAG